MKLLKHIKFYAIKADYFMYDSETDAEYIAPVYYAIDDSDERHIINMTDTVNDMNLRIFGTYEEAQEYSNRHQYPQCMENQRVVEICYDFMDKEWREK